MNYRKRNNQDLLDVILLKMYTKIAENEIENLMEKARHTFGFAPEDYEIKKIASSLASLDNDTSIPSSAQSASQFRICPLYSLTVIIF